MSPGPSGGLPHTRAASINGGVPVNPTNGMNMNGSNGAKSPGRIFDHLDDLVAAKPNVDIHSSIRKILIEGEILAKQADTHLDFRRPDIALQEYVKASIIAVDIVPRHKDYPTLQADRGELHRLYTGLTKRINAQHPKFAEVKEAIKENNAKSGVLPKISKAPSAIEGSSQVTGIPHHERGLSAAQNGTSIIGASPRKKPPPPVQPKPDALHGNAIHPPGGPKSDSPQVDLAARFARLRGPESSIPKQDPRIRTQPISIPNLPDSKKMPSVLSPSSSTTINRQIGPREMPSVPKTLPRSTKVPLDVAIPVMPRPPDAIYSPARGPDNASTVNLPTSVSRSSSYSSIGRQDSAPPISTVGPTSLPGGRQEYFQPAHTIGHDLYSRKVQTPKPNIPDSKAVTAEDLIKYLRLGSQNLTVLLVDLRSREDFDAGHIMSQSIICVEPLTLRHGISGDELADSMVIAPEIEQQLYQQRSDFDLVVYYDQSSTGQKSSSSREIRITGILDNFKDAVYEFGYDKRLKRHPLLLLGGLDAWVDLLGPNSLETSSTGLTSTAAGPNNGKIARPLGRPMARDSRAAANAREKKYQSRPLTKEEESAWDKTLREESQPSAADASSPSELVYARTTEDFVRRFPELPAIQESMISSPSPPSTSHSYQEEFAGAMPKPPTRPAPALPRQRSSGITEKDRTATHAHTIGSTEPSSITSPRVVPGLTGLNNPGNLCYLNSSIQALSSTPIIRDLLINYRHPAVPPIPRKADEKTEPPQLMVRVLGNVLGHLWCGQYDWINPRTFAKYVKSINSQSMTNNYDRERAFGAISTQQDASEFLDFLLNILNDELNPRRNIQVKNLTDQERNDGTLIQASNRWWANEMLTEASPLTEHMRGQLAVVITCTACQTQSRTFNSWTSINLMIRKSDQTQTLASAMRNDWNSPHPESIQYTCEKCNNKTGTQLTMFDNLPDIIVLHLARFTRTNQKVQTVVTFPENGIDLSPCAVPINNAAHHELGPRRQGSLLYDVFAVMQHRGDTPRSGHYWAITRSMDKPRIVNGHPGPGNWHRYNDMTVSPIDFSATQASETMCLFLKRRRG